jgi:acyl carrier protein
MNVGTSLRRHLSDSSLLGISASSVGDDDNLFELIDSLQMLRLIAHLEKTFRIEIDDGALDPVYLQSIRSLSELVERKMNVAV